MAPTDRYLIGPDLLLGMVLSEPQALKFVDKISSSDCVISLLTVAITRSVIKSQAGNEAQRESLENRLDQVIAGTVASGAAVVDVDASTLKKYPLYRRHPLDYEGDGEHLPIGQETRLLIATAHAQALVFAEYAALYLDQLDKTTSVRTYRVD